MAQVKKLAPNSAKIYGSKPQAPTPAPVQPTAPPQRPTGKGPAPASKGG
jgi:hypothetical protein